jgi:creatinine amidohydrolase
MQAHMRPRRALQAGCLVDLGVNTMARTGHQEGTPVIAADLSFARLTWEEAGEAALRRDALIIPVGSIEPHGPHLPLETDIIIAEAMAEAAARTLRGEGTITWVLPPLPYVVTDFARGFGGAVSVTSGEVAALLSSAAASLARLGFRKLAIANAHLEPAHLASLREAVTMARRHSGVHLLFPDITTKRWGRMLTAEFRSGACHAGRFETSIVMAREPATVREEIRKSLIPNPTSLSEKIREGVTTFKEAGGPMAYFGDPAAATTEEGHATIATLGGILASAIREGRSE